VDWHCSHGVARVGSECTGRTRALSISF
jgi:hypothetical protein